MKKYIFLDIDGVVATPEVLIDGFWSLSDRCQKFLGQIIDKTGAEIILSSSWRLNNLEKTHEKMNNNGFWFTDKIIGVTIRAYQYIDKKTKIHLSIPRGVEIQQWIDTNVHSDNGKNFQRKTLGVDYNYVILDDESDMLYNQRDNFVYTNSTIGLTQDDVSKAIEILNKVKK